MRAANTYRGARRNHCFDNHYVWGPQFYYDGHSAAIKTRARAAKRRIVQVETDNVFAATMKRVFTPPALRLRRGARGQ